MRPGKPPFDSYKLAVRLREAGFTEPQVVVLIDLFWDLGQQTADAAEAARATPLSRFEALV